MSAEAIFEALGELDEGLIREGREAPLHGYRPRKMLLLAAVVALLAVLALTVVIVTLRSLHAATCNPVESLRNE